MAGPKSNQLFPVQGFIGPTFIEADSWVFGDILLTDAQLKKK